jgi:hypothetical protein
MRSGAAPRPRSRSVTVAEEAGAYLDDHAALSGRVIDQRTAVELAGGVFGALLRNPA